MNDALSQLGVRAEVVDGTLIVTWHASTAARADRPSVDAAMRRTIVEIARAHGFTHVALDVTDADDAALPRAEPSA
jgi:hypothetical protein